MKYSRLTKEQFEALHLEFARFLAALGIDAEHWKQLKEEKSPKVEELLDFLQLLLLGMKMAL